MVCVQRCGGKLSQPNQVHKSFRNMYDRLEFKCPYGCPQDKLKFMNLLGHVKSACPERLEACEGCGMALKHSEVEKHKKDCKFKIFSCNKCHELETKAKKLEDRVSFLEK